MNPEKLGGFENLANVAGWKLEALVGQGVAPTSYRNVMILKFCSGSLQDRVTNPNQWTSPEDFSLAPGTTASGANTAYAGLSQWLQAYVQAGIDKAVSPSSADFYKNFADVVTDPDWQGVIVLEAGLSITDLPPEIAGLAAGIDLTEFTAHHFGFTVSRVTAEPGEYPPLAMQGDSSFFGLIDYENTAYAQNLANGVSPEIPVPVAVSDDFQFTVLLLEVLFENSKLANFRSNVQFSVESLLGSAVTRTIGNSIPGVSAGTPMPANAIVLDGSYVAQSGAGSDSNAYVFEQTHTSVFVLDSNVLHAVAFSNVQFSTLAAQEGSDSTTSRFLVWGAFDFVSLTDANGLAFDVLSFGSAPGTSDVQLGAGLAFSNLVIDMTSPNATPNVQTFDVSLANLAYDLNASTARKDSLFLNFGPQLKSFLTAGEDDTPTDSGFLAVNSDLNLELLTAPWYGVVYRLSLGGPGALASAAGFDSDLLVAWSPATAASDAEAAVFLGMSLPGASPGAKQFSLEGVFKISTGAITLLRQQVEGSQQMSFCLRMDDVGIKIFGITKIPPDATIQFFLFGDPDSTGSLGWYAAYVAQTNQLEMAGGSAR